MSGRILIVDDVATNRIVYKVKLGAACYEPLLAADGAGCLRLAKEQKPDLILLDMILPDMSGTEVLLQLRANHETSAIPIVVFSAHGDAEHRRSALKAGADDFLNKSTDDETLLARLRNLLRGREAITELERGGAPIHALGFAEANSQFRMPGTIALVSLRPETALHWRRDLSGVVSDNLVMLSREEALADPPLGSIPDVYLVEADQRDKMGGLRLMSELRSRSQTRHAAICIVQADSTADDTAMAYDLGANDLVSARIDPQELGLRLNRLMHRKREADQLRASVRDGLRLAVIDPLTGLHNRRYAISELESIAQKANEKGETFAVMVIDLDRFKEVNDRHGHPAGDAVLVEVARRMAENIRSGDLLARFGGEEFLVALPGANLSMALPIAERICQSLQERPFSLPGLGRLDLTASIGMAMSDLHQTLRIETISDVIDRADRALLVAKSCGRNQVTISRSAA